MVSWMPPKETPQEPVESLYKPHSIVPKELHPYEFLIAEGRVTPELIESMKRGFAKTYERMCKNAEFIAKFKGAEHDRRWLAWQIDCCEPCNKYIQLFKLFRDKGIVSFTDRDLETCFGLYEYKPMGAVD